MGSWNISDNLRISTIRRKLRLILSLKMKKFKHRTHNYFIGGDQFKKEFISQLRFLIIVTLGFTIAFTWRQTIFDTTQSIVNFFLHLESSATLSILTSTTITITALFIILLTSKLLNPKRFN